MTDDLKERLQGAIEVNTIMGDENLPRVVILREALSRITDLEAQLAAAEAGEDALAEVLEEIAHDEDSADPKCGCRPCRARFALAAYEARRKGK